jgi:hypothetical protein
MTASIYNCNVTVFDHEGNPLIVKNAFVMKRILVSLQRVVDKVPTKTDEKIVNDFRKETKCSKALSNSILSRWLQGSVDSAAIEVNVA